MLLSFLYYVFVIGFKHIQHLSIFVYFCQYTVMSIFVPAKARSPVRGDSDGAQTGTIIDNDGDEDGNHWELGR